MGFAPAAVAQEVEKAGDTAEVSQLLKEAKGRLKEAKKQRGSAEGELQDEGQTILEEEGAQDSAWEGKNLPAWSPGQYRRRVLAVPGQQQAFNARPRDDPLIAKRFYGEHLSPGPTAIPKYHLVHREHKSNVRLLDFARFTKPRSGDPMTPKHMPDAREPGNSVTRTAARRGLGTRAEG